MNKWLVFLVLLSACRVPDDSGESAGRIEMERARYGAMQERLMQLPPESVEARHLADSIAANAQFRQDALGAIEHFRRNERLLTSIFGDPVQGGVYRLEGSSADRWSKERMQELSDSIRLASGVWWDRMDILGEGTDFHADTLGVELSLRLREKDISVESLTEYVIEYSMEATLRPPEGVDSLESCQETRDFAPCVLATPEIFRRVFSMDADT